MSTCQVSAVPLLWASSAKHQTLALGKPVLKARLFRHFPRKGSGLRLDRTFPRTVPSLLHQAPDLHRTLAFADRHCRLVLTARHSYSTGQARRCSATGKTGRPRPRKTKQPAQVPSACQAGHYGELRPHGSHAMQMRTLGKWMGPTSHQLPRPDEEAETKLR